LSNTERGKKELCTWVLNNKEKIIVHGGDYNYNLKCHLNSVHFARQYNEPTIAMVMYGLETEDPTLHFINVNKEGEFWDNTLGSSAVYEDFYLLRLVQEEEYTNINNVFRDYLAYTKTVVSWWARFRAGKGRLC
jgi:hypothetical protein